MKFAPSSMVLFKNWSLTDFTHSWNGVPYSFRSGEEKWMEGWMAAHFAKHLTDREMNVMGLMTDDHRRHEYEQKCFVPSDSLPAERAGDPFARKFELLNRQKEAEKQAEPEAPAPTPEQEAPAPEAAKARFCDECDSKGVRHKKDCPKNAFAALKNEAANA